MASFARAGSGAPFEPGEIVAGKYRVESLIGEGGMGFVISALHLSLGRRVALKVLRPRTLESDDAVARFLHEARAAALLQSEHIARVTDVGKLDSGAPYMVMELLEGIDFSKVIDARAPLPIDEALDFIAQACEGLAEAHINGIVHRDLKPANLFLTARLDGAPLVKVLDFGISKSKLNAPLGEITSTASLVGSPRYMSPEQMQDSRAVDPRTDIWALGAILYEMLAARPPFDSPTVAGLCVKIINDRAPPLKSARPDAPDELCALIDRCLAKDPAERYASVAELAEALAPLVRGDTLSTVQRTVRIVRGAKLSPRTFPNASSPRQRSSAKPAIDDRPPASRRNVTTSTPDLNELPTVGELVAVRRSPPRATMLIAALLLLGAAVIVVVALRNATRPAPDAASIPSSPSAQPPPP